jgi:hypothetical protein
MPIPTQSSTSTVAEAPRPARDHSMAGFLARGSWQLAAFPSCRLRTDISGIGQALTAYSCGGSRGFESSRSRSMPTTFPLRSLRRERPSERGSTTLRRRIVNGKRDPVSARQRPQGLLSPSRRCITLAALSGALPDPGVWGVKREAGASGVIAAQSRHCPRNGKRIKANTTSLRLKGAGRHSPAMGIRESGDRPGIEQRIPSRRANRVNE